MGFQVAPEEPAVVFPALHHDFEVCQLGRPFVDFKAVKVMSDDGFHSAPVVPAGGAVNVHEKVEGVGQNVAASHAGIQEGEVFGIELFSLFPKGMELFFHCLILLCFGNIVFPLGLQCFIGVSFQPQAAQTVFHHVPHNPVGSEKLGGRGDGVFCDFLILLQSVENVFLRFRIVVLVHPAHNLHLFLPVFFGNIMGQAVYHPFPVHDGKAEEEFRVVVGFFKETGQQGMELVAHFKEEHAEKGVAVISVLHLPDAAHFIVRKGKAAVFGPGHKVRLHLSFGDGGQGTDVAGEVVIHFHETDGNETVEPGIGDFFHDSVVAVFVVPAFGGLCDTASQPLPLVDGFAGNDHCPGPAGHIKVLVFP